jgi:hypothetical protein
MRYTLILCLLLTSCATTESIVTPKPLATPEDVAKQKIKPNLDLPPSLDLTKYKLDESKIKQYKEGEQVYIALPEKDMQEQQEFLLVLKTRILELQKIIINAKKLM